MADPPPAISQLVLSDFIIVEELLRSGSGTVFKARHRPTGRFVVLKEKHSSELGKTHSLSHEFEILSKLSHENIVQCLGIVRKDTGVVIVLEYADSGDLHAFLRRQRKQLPARTAVRIMREITSGLHYLHGQNVLHRDLKTSNILIHRGVHKIGDFGISRVLDDLSSTFSHGTPLYMSPEFISSIPYDFKADIWALGIIFYEILMLRPPFEARTISDLARAIRRGEFEPVRGFPPEFDQLVATCLEKEPAARPDTGFILSAVAEIEARLDDRSHSDGLSIRPMTAPAMAASGLAGRGTPEGHGGRNSRVVIHQDLGKGSLVLPAEAGPGRGMPDAGPGVPRVISISAGRHGKAEEHSEERADPKPKLLTLPVNRDSGSAGPVVCNGGRSSPAESACQSLPPGRAVAGTVAAAILEPLSQVQGTALAGGSERDRRYMARLFQRRSVREASDDAGRYGGVPVVSRPGPVAEGFADESTNGSLVVSAAPVPDSDSTAPISIPIHGKDVVVVAGASTSAKSETGPSEVNDPYFRMKQRLAARRRELVGSDFSEFVGANRELQLYVNKASAPAGTRSSHEAPAASSRRFNPLTGGWG